MAVNFNQGTGTGGGGALINLHLPHAWTLIRSMAHFLRQLGTPVFGSGVAERQQQLMAELPPLTCVCPFHSRLRKPFCLLSPGGGTSELRPVKQLCSACHKVIFRVGSNLSEGFFSTLIALISLREIDSYKILPAGSNSRHGLQYNQELIFFPSQ